METESEVEVPLSRVVRGAGPDDVEISGADAGEGQSVTPHDFYTSILGEVTIFLGRVEPPPPTSRQTQFLRCSYHNIFSFFRSVLNTPYV